MQSRKKTQGDSQPIKTHSTHNSTKQRTKDETGCKKELSKKENTQAPIDHISTTLEFQRDQLEQTLVVLENQLEELKQLDEELDERLREEEVAVENESIKIDNSIASTLKVMMDLMKEVDSSNLKESSIVYSYLFQSRRALDEVLEADRLYIEELTRRSEKLFGNGKENALTEYEENKIEMERLTTLYSITEKQYIEAMIKLEASRAEVEVLEDMAEGLQGLPGDPQILKSQLLDYERRIEKYSAHINEIFESELDELLVELSELEIRAPLLKLNYEERMDELLEKGEAIEKVLDALISQHARNEFLKTAFELDIERQRKARHLIAAIKENLEARREIGDQRIEMMSSDYFTEAVERKTVDSRDEFLLGVKRLLDVEQANISNMPGTPKPSMELFTTYDALIHKIGTLVERKRKAEKVLSDDIEERWKFMESCREIEKGLTDRLYSHSSPDEELTMMPKDLQDLQNKTSQKTTILQTKMKEITKNTAMTKEIEKKKKIFQKFWKDREKEETNE